MFMISSTESRFTSWKGATVSPPGIWDTIGSRDGIHAVIEQRRGVQWLGFPYSHVLDAGGIPCRTAAVSRDRVSTGLGRGRGAYNRCMGTRGFDRSVLEWIAGRGRHRTR